MNSVDHANSAIPRSRVLPSSFLARFPLLTSLALTLVTVAAATLPQTVTAQATEATITGPIAAGAPNDPERNAILNASAIELQDNGYVEEEFFIEGRANRYGSSGMDTRAGFCRLYGSHLPFDTTKLEKLYPSHDSYV